MAMAPSGLASLGRLLLARLDVQRSRVTATNAPSQAHVHCAPPLVRGLGPPAPVADHDQPDLTPEFQSSPSSPSRSASADRNASSGVSQTSAEAALTQV